MDFKHLAAGLLTLAAVTSQAANVACVGNSITYGYGLSDGKYSYPTRLQELLGSSYSVTNFGVSSMTFATYGNSSYWSTDRFTAAMNSNPNTVVIELGTNDSKFFMGNYADQGIYNWAYGQVSKADLQRDYRALIDTFAHLSTKPEIYATLQPYSNNVSWTITDTAIVNVINPIIFDASVEKGVNIIDLHTLFNTPSWYLSDSVHPNDDGAYELAKIIYSHLSQAKPAISVSGSTLKVAAGYGFYWYKDGVLISGANAQTYTATAKGTYKALVKMNASTNSYWLTDEVEVDGSSSTETASAPQITCDMTDVVAYLDSSECGGKKISVKVVDGIDSKGVAYTSTLTREDGKTLDDIFPIGTTKLTYTFSNAIGSVSCPQSITVKDTLAPNFDCSSLQDVSFVVDTTSNTANAIVDVVRQVPSVTDCDSVIEGIPSRADGKALTEAFADGVNIINWTFADAYGNAKVCQQNFIVTQNDLVIDCDNIDTFLVVPACSTVDSVYYEAPVITSTDLAGNKYTAVATRSDSLLMTDAFPLGETKVTWTFTFGNKLLSCSQNIKVVDLHSPSIPDCATLNDIKVSADTAAIIDRSVFGNPIVSTECNDSIVGVPTRADGKLLSDAFPLDTTIVNWQYNIEGLVLVCKQNVIVEKASGLQVVCDIPDNIFFADADNCGADIQIDTLMARTANGILIPVDVTRDDSLDLNDIYPIGTTSLTWTFKENGKTGICEQKIIVVDTIAPTFDCSSLKDVEFADCNIYCDQVYDTVGKVKINIIGPYYADSLFAQDCQGRIAGELSYEESDDVIYHINLIWTFTDASNNSTVCKQRLDYSYAVYVENVAADVNLSYENGSLCVGDNGYELLNVDVYDMQGRLVSSREIVGGANRVALGLKTGTYIVVLSDNATKVASLKIKE